MHDPVTESIREAYKAAATLECQLTLSLATAQDKNCGDKVIALREALTLLRSAAETITKAKVEYIAPPKAPKAWYERVWGWLWVTK